jgi:hypothetical protein
MMWTHHFKEQTAILSYARAAGKVTLPCSKILNMRESQQKPKEHGEWKAKEAHSRELQSIIKLLMNIVHVTLIPQQSIKNNDGAISLLILNYRHEEGSSL